MHMQSYTPAHGATAAAAAAGGGGGGGGGGGDGFGPDADAVVPAAALCIHAAFVICPCNSEGYSADARVRQLIVQGLRT